jgi:hypothetical protein
MIKPAIALSLIVTASVVSFQAQAVAENQCAAAIADFKAARVAAESVRGEYKRNRSRKGRCVYLRSQVEYVAEARKVLGTCDHLHRPERQSLIEKAESLLQRIKALKSKYCGLQVAEASSVFQIYAASERDLSH